MRLGTRHAGIVCAIAILGMLGPLAVQAAAQTAELQRHRVRYNWDSGKYDGSGDRRTDGVALARKVVRDVVSVPGSPWLQLTFVRSQLGNASYLRITSVADGASQRLDTATLRQWHGRSAFFNGDAVVIELFVDAQDRAVSVEIAEVVAGDWAFSVTKSICGTDNRIASGEPRVARIDPIGCTGWIVSNGKQLTAGHCLAGGASNATLSFNPPPSLPDGTVQFPPPADQYSIDQASFQFTNGGIGNDWGIFSVFNNTQTGLQPIQAQGAFTVRQDLGPANIRITGFGVDDGTTNQTNQTHVGPNTGSSGTTMRYATDTTGGNSGSPVIDETTGEAVGIHTNGGCSASGGNNSGTSFFNSALWTALDAAGGPPPPPPPPPALNCPAGSIDFTSLALTSYANQNVTNATAVQDGGNILALTGNTWVRSTQTFTITPNTVIEFQFASGSEGEIHAIGFDNDDTLNNDPRHFQFWGTQNWTGTGKIDLTPKYSGSGSFESYSIPVGRSYTGTMNLVFTNDKDSGTLDNESQFGCVHIFEDGAPPPPPPGGCTVDDDFEGGAAGWANDGASTCSTGAFVLTTPTQQTSTVVTQVGGDHTSGVGNAIFTATNTSAGNADVDGGTCVLTSPVWSVASASTFSVWYFHGQRDTGDDPGGDFFELEISTDGGATFSSVVSIGDVRTVASWTNATAAVPAGANVQLRLRVADGSGPGDIVEGGIDDLSICAN